MRPAELDYTSYETHFFDTQNGEILRGQDELDNYVEQGADIETVYNLGLLLRDRKVALTTENYDSPETINWDRDQFVGYGRWIDQIVAPPIHREDHRFQENRLNRDVFDQAARLGLGPGKNAIRRNFGSLSRFYIEIDAESAQFTGVFQEWSIDDFVTYIKSRGNGKRPTTERLREVSRRDPTKPSPDLISTRFKDIGGFSKILELAGYTVVNLWDEQDYIEWGVKFMEANDGELPTSRMANFLSRKHLGPAGRTIIDNFNKISVFQRRVAEEYYNRKDEQAAQRQLRIDRILDDFAAKKLPYELFADLSLENDAETKETLAMVLNGKNANEAILRWAKYSVLNELTPNISSNRRASLSRGEGYDRGFVAAIRKHHDIPAGEIECAALTLDVFDAIWPMDDFKAKLKLGDEYEEYIKEFYVSEYRKRVEKKAAAESQ